MLPLDLFAVPGFDVAIGEGGVDALDFASDGMTGAGVGDVGVVMPFGQAKVADDGLDRGNGVFESRGPSVFGAG